MSVGAFTVFDKTIQAMGRGDLGDLRASPIAAVLLGTGYVPDVASHETFADVSIEEISGGTYSPLAVTGVDYTNIAGGFNFTSANISWGTSATIPNCRYLVIVRGNAASLSATDIIVGFQDLITEGGSVSATSGEFTIQTPVGGWFDITRAA